MHDLVRDYVRSRLPAAQLCAMQHNVVATILEARSNSVGAAGPDAAHDEYVATNLRHHIAGAVGHIARLDEDDVLMAALSHEDKLVFTEAAHGVGAERLRAASDACATARRGTRSDVTGRGSAPSGPPSSTSCPTSTARAALRECCSP